MYDSNLYYLVQNEGNLMGRLGNVCPKAVKADFATLERNRSHRMVSIA